MAAGAELNESLVRQEVRAAVERYPREIELATRRP